MLSFFLIGTFSDAERDFNPLGRGVECIFLSLTCLETCAKVDLRYVAMLIVVCKMTYPPPWPTCRWTRLTWIFCFFFQNIFTRRLNRFCRKYWGLGHPKKSLRTNNSFFISAEHSHFDGRFWKELRTGNNWYSFRPVPWPLLTHFRQILIYFFSCSKLYLSLSIFFSWISAFLVMLI